MVMRNGAWVPAGFVNGTFPAELILGIGDLLDPADHMNLALTCRLMYKLLSRKSIQGLDFDSKLHVLQHMSRKLPDHWLCTIHMVWHKRLSIGDTVSVDCMRPQAFSIGGLNGSFLIPDTSARKFIHLLPDLEASFDQIQGALRREMFGEAYGHALESLPRKEYRVKARKGLKASIHPVVSEGRLYLHAVMRKRLDDDVFKDWNGQDVADSIFQGDWDILGMCDHNESDSLHPLRFAIHSERLGESFEPFRIVCFWFLLIQLTVLADESAFEEYIHTAAVTCSRCWSVYFVTSKISSGRFKIKMHRFSDLGECWDINSLEWKRLVTPRGAPHTHGRMPQHSIDAVNAFDVGFGENDIRLIQSTCDRPDEWVFERTPRPKTPQRLMVHLKYGQSRSHSTCSESSLRRSTEHGNDHHPSEPPRSLED